MFGIKGFKERFGEIPLKEEYIKRVLFDTAISFDYKKIIIPTLENAKSFSPAVIGKAPWPEWNENGCFYFEIENYLKDYNTCSKEKVLLIPEGTISVTRWLGEKINKGDYKFPIKLFYSLTCYRNEILAHLSDTKHREFEQFGMEILGSSNILSDVENMHMVCACLKKLDIKPFEIRIRLSDTHVFNNLIQDSKISEDDAVTLREVMDYFAESKAGKHQETYKSCKEKLYSLINKTQLPISVFNCWAALFESGYNDLAELTKVFPSKYHTYFCILEEIRKEFAKQHICVDIDLCVVRSHEYYTGISFEVDVISQNQSFFEIAVAEDTTDWLVILLKTAKIRLMLFHARALHLD